MTSKTGKPLADYFGTSKTVQTWKDPQKEILIDGLSKMECRTLELLLQLHYRFDDRLVNQIVNIRGPLPRKLSHEIEYKVYQDASALLEMLEFGCGHAICGRKDALLLMRGDLLNKGIHS